MMEFKIGGRRVDAKGFADGLMREALERAFAEMETRVYGAAASIVDPETGKHADVFVRRHGDDGVVVRTKGSPAFASELERRLGVDTGSIKSIPAGAAETVPNVYLAHASEDRERLAEPLARKLLDRGIEVWLDKWEIKSGDSLRRKMEEGLSDCTHFLVLLTPNSLGKPWVEAEIDAGFVQAVEGTSRFIGVRVGVPVGSLSPFLRTLSCPEIQIEMDDQIEELVGDIYGVSRKPPRGEAPRYVKKQAQGIAGWSTSAAAVAKHLVVSSRNGGAMDPQSTVAETAMATGLPEQDVRLGILDLVDNGLVEETRETGSDRFWPKAALFVEFDRYFLDFDNESDAVLIANHLVNEKIERIEPPAIAEKFPDWSPRRINSALLYLEGVKAIDLTRAMGQAPWVCVRMRTSDRTLRFVRAHG